MSDTMDDTMSLLEPTIEEEDESEIDAMQNNDDDDNEEKDENQENEQMHNESRAMKEKAMIGESQSLEFDSSYLEAGQSGTGSYPDVKVNIQSIEK
ncbi:hypothetical protein HMI55_004517 [Coelomomyces lativittatus]|nr:hypothetical protein HMI55_004517 [Coelomomyces lativittatus]